MEFTAYTALVEALLIGKRLPDATYLHHSALRWVSKELAEFTTQLAEEYADDLEWDIAKYFRRDFKVSLLSYPTFLEESYPALSSSVTIDLVRKKVRKIDYSESENPPILHRKEAFVAPTHPSFSGFTAITKEGEALGLYENSKRIGFKKTWGQLISSKGYTLVNGRLVAKADRNQSIQDEKNDVNIERHRTAIYRDQLSSPMQCLARHDYLNNENSVFDYGCGKGHDIAELEAHGLDAVGWDPEYRPETRKRCSDIVNLGFVINVIEDRAEREAVLKEAFQLSKKVLAVAVMIAGDATIQRYTPHKDGVITSRNTFQKYYSQSEIRSFIEAVLQHSAIAVAPGVFFVFKDEQEEQRFLSMRQRVRREWRQVTVRHRTATTADHADLINANEPLFREFWTTCLDLGRPPANDEFERSEELRRIIGSPKKAFTGCSKYFDATEYQAAQEGRMEDLLVFTALSFFGRQQAYRKMPVGLQRDIKTFFGKPSIAHDAARESLFSVASTEGITAACLNARERLDCGYLEADHSYTFCSAMLSRLPSILRIYVGCAMQLYGDIDEVDLIKIHMTSGKVSLMIYDDFSKPLPLLKARIKVRLRDQEIDWFYYGGAFASQPLYLKSLYLDEHSPTLAAQDRFDRQITRLKGIDLSAQGPSLPEFETLLLQNGVSFAAIEREYRQSLSDSKP